MKRILVFVFISWAVLNAGAQSFSEVTNLLDNPDIGVFAVGTTIVDVNSDGLLDLYRFQGTFLQQLDGSFLESSAEIGFKNPDGTTAEGSTVFGAIFSDYDNDGYVDAFFEDLTTGSRLFKNRGDGSFYQANDESGIDIFSALQGSVWADFDNNGFLDLFVGGDGDPSGLFLNNGDSTFENASSRVSYFPFRNVYGVAAADFDNDGDIDIYLSSCSQDVDASRNMFFRNDGAAGFTDIAPSLGLDDDRGGWAVVWTDVNNDSWLDLFVANQPVSGAGIETRPGFNRLYINNGAGGFTDMAPAMGIAGPENQVTIGATAADFNNDGWIDIITTTNSGSDGPTVYLNNAGASFSVTSAAALDDTPGQAISSADINEDGWVDVFMAGFQGEHLFFNDGGDSHWLTVALSGNQSNYNGIGSKITAHAPGLTAVREISAGDGMTAQNAGLRAHFGLAEHTTLDSLVVQWPSGQRDVIPGVQSDQSLRIAEGEGINHAPRAFPLLYPARDSILGAPASVDFEWAEAADPDTESLVYRLKVLDPSGALLTTVETSDTRASLDGGLFQDDTNYAWIVDVDDGATIIRSSDRRLFSVAIPSAVEDLKVERTSAPTAYPNPFGSTTKVSLRGLNHGNADVYIYNLTGKLVRVLPLEHGHSDRSSFVWDGTTGDGSAAPSGIYFYRLGGGSTNVTGSVIKL